MTFAARMICVLAGTFVSVAGFAQLPDCVDNSHSKYFPPLINQKGGSCAQASAIGYMFTYEMNRLLDRDASASAANRFSYQYTYNLVNEGKDNGSFGWDGLTLAAANGIITEEDWPESGVSSFKWASGYQKYYNAAHYKVKTFNTLNINKWSDLTAVKQYLYDENQSGRPGGVVVFSTKATNWVIDNSYSGPSGTGYHSILTKLATEGGHALTIAGYDDLVEFTTPDGSVSKGAFIVVNTWGTYSHDNGRFYLPYWFFFNNPGSLYLSSNVTYIVPSYQEPEIVFKVGVECDSRDDLSFKLGVSGNPDDKQPVHNMQVKIADHQGGDIPMQGYWWPSDIEFGFDFSSIAHIVDGYETPSYFLTIERAARGKEAATVANLISFEVYDYRLSRNMPVVETFHMRGQEKIALESGNNVFGMKTPAPVRFSCTPVEWLSSQTGQPVSAPLVMRTADGKYVKIRFEDYDRESGTIRMKYIYNPNGGTDLR